MTGLKKSERGCELDGERKAVILSPPQKITIYSSALIFCVTWGVIGKQDQHGASRIRYRDICELG